MNRWAIFFRPSDWWRRACCALGDRFGGTGFGLLFGFEFLAPAFDFRVVENLAHDPAEESLQARAFQIPQAADRFFFVALQEIAATLIGLKLAVERLNFGGRS